MKIRHSRIATFFLLSLPFFGFASVVGVIAFRHTSEMSAMMGMAFPRDAFVSDLRVVFFAFAVSLVLEAFLFLSAIAVYEKQARNLATQNREQERAGMLLVRRDLELTQANEQLRNLDEIKSGFISVVAHQLRTPLSGIKWTLNLLQNGDLGSLTEEQKNFLMKAYESNDRMISLVNDLLGADRIDSGKARYTLLPLPLVSVIESVLFEMTPQATARGLTISFEKSRTPFPEVLADAERIRAVLQNLIENAVKYSRSGGAILVALSQPSPEYAQVAIQDNGIGIPKEDQRNIFSRFFRAENAVKIETEGSGLGLYIAKSIVERHGGRIWFESPKGKGVTFAFTLPLARAA